VTCNQLLLEVLLLEACCIINKQSYQLTYRVFDDKHTNTTTVIINVLDVNDNPGDTLSVTSRRDPRHRVTSTTTRPSSTTLSITWLTRWKKKPESQRTTPSTCSRSVDVTIYVNLVKYRKHFYN